MYSGWMDVLTQPLCKGLASFYKPAIQEKNTETEKSQSEYVHQDENQYINQGEKKHTQNSKEHTQNTCVCVGSDGISQAPTTTPCSTPTECRPTSQNR